MRQWSSRAALLLILSSVLFLSLGNLSSGASFPVQLNCIITGAPTDMGTCLTNTLPLALAGVLLSLSFVALAYMLGEFVQIQGLKGWYRNELKETAKSLILIAVVVSSLVILSGIASVLTGAAPPVGQAPTNIEQNIGNLYYAASGYLGTQQTEVGNAYNHLIGVGEGIGILSGLRVSLWVPVPVVLDPFYPLVCIVCLQFGSAENIYSSTIVTASDPTTLSNSAFLNSALQLLVVPMYFATTAQYDILPYIMQVGLLILFPIGIILRAIPFLRPIGGTLIAIGITASLIYPLTIVLLNQQVTNWLTTNISLAASDSCVTPNIAIIGAFICWQENLASSLSGALAGLSSATSIYPAFNYVTQVIFPTTVLFILYVLDVIIVVTVAQNIANALGGTIRLGIGRMKLA